MQSSGHRGYSLAAGWLGGYFGGYLPLAIAGWATQTVIALPVPAARGAFLYLLDRHDVRFFFV